jgi:hypothetical protein
MKIRKQIQRMLYRYCYTDGSGIHYGTATEDKEAVEKDVERRNKEGRLRFSVDSFIGIQYECEEKKMKQEDNMEYLKKLLKGTQYNEGGIWSPGSFQTVKNEAYRDVIEVSLYGRERDYNFITSQVAIEAIWKGINNSAFTTPDRKAWHVLEYIRNNK